MATPAAPLSLIAADPPGARSDTAAPAARTRGLLTSVAVLVIALALALAFVITRRGPWFDEFFTLYVTSRGEGFVTALTAHWLPDNHPPLYYALVDLTGWLGPTVEARRWVNGLIGLVALGGGIAAARSGSPRLRFLAALYFAGLAAQPMLVIYAAELRSYFLSLTAVAVLVLALVREYLEPGQGGRWARLPLWVGAAVAFNTHIATTLITGAMIGSFLLVALLRRRLDFVRTVLPAALPGGLLFLAVTAVQAQQWEANTRVFWIAPGLVAARWAIEMTFLAACKANPVLLAGGLAGLTLMALTAWRGQARPALACVAALGLTAALSLAAILAIHLAMRPFVIGRYLIALVPVLAMVLALGLAELAGDRPARRSAVMVLAVAASLVALWGNARETVTRRSWTGTSTAIAEEVRRCRGTVVHQDPVWNAELTALPPADNRAVPPFAYALMAKRHGFTIEPSASRRVSRSCPTVFWTEHSPAPTPSAFLARLRATGYPFSGVSIRVIEDGWLGYGLR